MLPHPAAADRALDIVEPQVLVHRPLANAGQTWCHSLLLHRIGAGRWVALDPDHELVVLDLAQERHHVLVRRGRYPGGAYNGEIYAHDPIDKATLKHFLVAARTQAMLLGDGDVPIEPEQVWVVIEEGPFFGQEVRLEDLDEPEKFVSLQKRGFLDIEGTVLECSQFPVATKDRDLIACRERHGDFRVLGKRSVDGFVAPSLSLVDAVAAFTEAKLPDWPFEGDRAVLEYLRAIATTQGNLVSYETDWTRNSGIAEGLREAHEHRNISEVLRLAHTVDGLNVPSCACFEQLVRRQIQIEMAVERNPKSPDFAGLHLVLGGALNAKGAANAYKFKSWVADRQRDEGQQLKQARLLRGDKVNIAKASGKQPKGAGKEGKDVA